MVSRKVHSNTANPKLQNFMLALLARSSKKALHPSIRSADAIPITNPRSDLQPAVERHAIDVPIDFFPNSFLRSERPGLKGLMIPPHYE